MDSLQNIFDKMLPGFCNIFGETLKSIILYGSTARGTATEESDVDIALIVQNYTKEMHEKMIDLTVELELDCGRVLSVILIEYDNFIEWENVLPFYLNVKKEGITLWSAA